MGEMNKQGAQKKLEAKVASIIDNYRVVINKGEVDGIRIGQRFLILAIGDEIVDPDTKESLGRIEIIKGKAKVTHIQERMATLETTDTHEIKRRSGSPFVGFLFDQSQEVTEEPKAFVDPAIGDIARST